MKTLFITLSLALSFSFAQSTASVSLVNYTFGGAGGILKLDDSTTFGVVIGQSVAGAQTGVNSGEGTITPGFWYEVLAVEAPDAVKPNIVPITNNGIAVSFHGSEAAIRFEVPAAAQGMVRIYSMNGREIANLWTGTLNSGVTSMTVPLKDISTQQVILRVQAGTMQRSFRFVPNH